MHAFRVHLNGRRLCVAGALQPGVVTTIVDLVTGKRRNGIHLGIGGLLAQSDEHVTWSKLPLNVGDEVVIKIVETASIDEPKKRIRHNSEEDAKSQRAYVRALAKKFGWVVRARPQKSKNLKLES